MKRYLLPGAVIAGFLVLVGFLYVGLDLNPRDVPSPLIDKPAPSFRVESLDQPERSISESDMQGQVWVLNVWASWCVSCRQEHPLLVELARRGGVPIYGLNYKDTRDDAHAWLSALGNPYTDSLFDHDGRVGLDWGVYGVPETFIIDKTGIIRHKHTGPIGIQDWTGTLWPLIQKLQAAAG